MTLDLPLILTNAALYRQIYRLAPQKLLSVPAAHQQIIYSVLFTHNQFGSWETVCYNI